MTFYTLHPKEIEDVRKQKNAIVIDLREREDYKKFHYKNAMNMPYCDNERWLSWFRVGQTYILYCDYGNVSLLAARRLAQRSVTVYTVVGGAKGLSRYFFND